jgi:filamentous hemagglutinin
MLVLNAAKALADPAFKAAFLDQAKMYKKVVDAKGEVNWQEMTPEEKAKIPPGSRVANNGIFNGGPDSPEGAQRLADQNSSKDAQYLVHFPQANNAVSELLVAGYQKFLESSATGLTNATQQNVDLWNQTGGNITLDGHSRGGMTVGNALTAVQEQGSKGGTTNVNLFGSAYNAQDAANTVNQITDGKGQVTSQVHKDDFVGTVLGGNAATGGTTPSGSSTLQEWIKILGGDSTSHNNYGYGRAVPDVQGGTKSDIEKYWGGAKPVPQTIRPTNQIISSPAGESK